MIISEKQQNINLREKKQIKKNVIQTSNKEYNQQKEEIKMMKTNIKK